MWSIHHSEHPLPERKRPPPLLPKPVHLQFWQANADMIYYETPSSFEKVLLVDAVLCPCTAPMPYWKSLVLVSNLKVP